MGQAWVHPGGTTFYFINDGPEHALELARESAGSRDIRIAGGADVIQQYLNMGVVDELEIAFASGAAAGKALPSNVAFLVDHAVPVLLDIAIRSRHIDPAEECRVGGQGCKDAIWKLDCSLAVYDGQSGCGGFERATYGEEVD